MSKSFVTIEQHQCPTCGIIFDTNALLLDRRLLNTFDSKTLTGNSLCSDCQEKIDQGFTILIIVKDGETGDNPYRTGKLLYFKACDPERQPKHPIMYIEESLAIELEETLGANYNG